MSPWEKIIVWLVIIVVFTFIFFLRRSEDSSLDECSRIAVADPIEISGSFKRGFTLSYKYEYQENHYTSSNSIDIIDFVRFGKEHFLTKRYYVKLQCQNPRLTRVLWDKPLPGAAVVPERNGKK